MAFKPVWIVGALKGLHLFTEKGRFGKMKIFIKRPFLNLILG